MSSYQVTYKVVEHVNAVSAKHAGEKAQIEARKTVEEYGLPTPTIQAAEWTKGPRICTCEHRETSHSPGNLDTPNDGHCYTVSCHCRKFTLKVGG